MTHDLLDEPSGDSITLMHQRILGIDADAPLTTADRFEALQILVTPIKPLAIKPAVTKWRLFRRAKR